MDHESQNWSYLVGKDGAKAVEIIKQETGLTDVEIIPPNFMVINNYRTDRINVYVDEQGKVACPPTIG